jgi:nucleoside-diphosphate-sugar epimerase
MRILVIGGTGFIGPHLVRQLMAAGHRATVLHRGQKSANLPDGVHTLHGDRQNLAPLVDELKRLTPDVVIDLICYSAAEATGLMQTFSGLSGRVVVASSQDVYQAYGCFVGLETGMPATAPLTEDAPLRESRYPYRQFADGLGAWVQDYDKILVEQAVVNDGRLPGTILRLPCIYGPRDKQRRTFEYLKRMDDGRAAILIGEQRAAWRWTRGYVENVAAAIALAATDDRAANRIYNVGEPEALSELGWARAIAQAASWTGELVIVPDADLPAHLRAPYNWSHRLNSDTSRIRSELGYTERVTRDDAMRQTVAWQRDSPPASIDVTGFDYAAEDALLATLKQPGA